MISYKVNTTIYDLPLSGSAKEIYDTIRANELLDKLGKHLEKVFENDLPTIYDISEYLINNYRIIYKELGINGEDFAETESETLKELLQINWKPLTEVPDIDIPFSQVVINEMPNHHTLGRMTSEKFIKESTENCITTMFNEDVMKHNKKINVSFSINDWKNIIDNLNDCRNALYNKGEYYHCNKLDNIDNLIRERINKELNDE